MSIKFDMKMLIEFFGTNFSVGKLFIVFIVLLIVLSPIILKIYKIILDYKTQKNDNLQSYTDFFKDFNLHETCELKRHIAEIIFSNYHRYHVPFEDIVQLIKRYNLVEIKDYIRSRNFLYISSVGAISIKKKYCNKLKVYARLFFTGLLLIVFSSILVAVGIELESVDKAFYKDPATIPFVIGLFTFFLSLSLIISMSKYDQAFLFIRNLKNE